MEAKKQKGLGGCSRNRGGESDVCHRYNEKANQEHFCSLVSASTLQQYHAFISLSETKGAMHVDLRRNPTREILRYHFDFSRLVEGECLLRHVIVIKSFGTDRKTMHMVLVTSPYRGGENDVAAAVTEPSPRTKLSFTFRAALYNKIMPQ